MGNSAAAQAGAAVAIGECRPAEGLPPPAAPLDVSDLPPGTAPPGSPLQEEGRCTFFVAAKGRYCRLLAVAGKPRCGAHAVNIQIKAGVRIPCPLDPGHTVYANRVAQHLRICSKRRQDEILVQQPFFSRGINSGDASATGPVRLPGVETHSGPEGAALQGTGAGVAAEALAERLCIAYRLAVRGVLGEQADPEELLERSMVAKGGALPHSEKHEVQNAALAALVSQQVVERALVVEYGCGRAGLAASLLAAHPGARCVLVEREGRRHKLENRQELRAERVLRLRLDIQDFDLAALLAEPLDAAALPRASDFQREALSACNVDESEGGARGPGPAERLEQLWRAAAALQEPPWPPQRVLACAKHLCGGATDVALRSLRPGRRGVAAAVCIATCCHHRCDSTSYVNLPFLRGLGLCEHEADFEQLAAAAGWAVGGRVDAREQRRIGMMAKRILDLGRVAWLRDELGLADAHLAAYVSKDVTPENMAILAGIGPP